MKRFFMIMLALVLPCAIAHAAVPDTGRRDEIKADMLGLKTGVLAPDFAARSYTGKIVRLSELYRQGPVVLIFYRGLWSSDCHYQLRSYEARIGEFAEKGASVVALSVDSPENAAQIAREDGLEFDVLSDPGARILQAYNVSSTFSDEKVDQFLREYDIDLEAYSGKKGHVIAVPATYVIDTTGQIIFARASEDDRTRPLPDEVLSVLGGA